MAAGIAEVVIATKLFRPSLKQQSVERTRLHAELRQGLTLPLTLVVAPAGWGKSTLVADWLARDAVTAGWVSLDSGDNDPKRFWRYLLLAADQTGSAAGTAALRRLDAAGSDVLRDVLPVFVNELASAEAPLVVVLDDYHLVTSRQVHATVATLLDRSPPQLHLVLITRADPPLPLSRLRVRGDLAELRAENLRFSAGEAAEFFSSRLGPLLSEQDVLRLLARTEGWAAGLQLAALRLRDRADPADFIEWLTGADWHIVNYLGEEVLASLSPEMREFLLVTSVLNRMCAPLCDALADRADSDSLISEIYRANLFLVALDDEHRWFRYHHLFGGLLRHELARTAPGRPPVLHRRAAQWYADHGDAAEAISHAIASGDEALSGRLVAAHWRRPFNAGQLETVRMWLGALPAELVATNASLSAARVWVALDTGRLEETGAALDAAESWISSDTQLMVLRALQLYKAGDVGRAAARLREISPSTDDPFIATVHRLVQGISWMWLGDTGRARELLVEAARRAEDDGNRLAYIYAEGCRALLAVNRGDLVLADSLVADAESAVGQTLSDSHSLAAGRGPGRQPPADRAHEHEDEADRHELERQHRPGRRPDPAVGEQPDDQPGGEGQRIPVGVAGQPRGAQEGASEDGHAHDRHRREDQVRAEQRPSGQEPGPRAEGVADEGVDRPGVAELARQPDEPVGHQPDAHGGDREGERGGPAELASGRHPGYRHRERGRHDADRNRRRLRETELTVKGRPPRRPG